MNIVIVGCGRVGAELAYRLFRRDNHVAVIDRIEASFRNLPVDFRGRTVEGEALNRDVLVRAGIQEAQGFAAVSSSDTLNAVVAHIARIAYHVPNIYVRNYDPLYRHMHEAFGHQIVSSSSWGAQRIEELLMNADIQTIYSAGNGEVEIYEFQIPSSWGGRSISELVANSQAIPVALTRAGNAVLPAPDTQLQQGDIVLFSAALEGAKELHDRLAQLKEA
jgi:trk system potassium uptake protein TrkA